MCAFDLRCPDTGKHIQKGTSLMVSDSKVPEQLDAFCRCPGNHEHRVVAGQLKSGQRVSVFVAQYTPKFVQTMLRAFGVGSHCLDVHSIACVGQLECLAAEANPAQPEASAPEEKVPKPRSNKRLPNCTEIWDIRQRTTCSGSSVEHQLRP